jgi:hypothetical protein
VGIRLFRKHPSWYLKGFPAGPVVRDGLSKVDSVNEVRTWVSRVDPTVPYPEEAERMVRGHSHGPRAVRLPRGFRDDRDSDGVGREADEAVSGG